MTIAVLWQYRHKHLIQVLAKSQPYWCTTKGTGGVNRKDKSFYLMSVILLNQRFSWTGLLVLH